MGNKKLNLKWVTEAIGEDYKTWKRGDIVLLQAQTGTGKTWFVKNVLLDYVPSYENILLVCNRINLKRQLKVDLLKKFGYEIPMIKDENGVKTDKIDMDIIDATTQINNIHITSYQAIQNSLLDAQYGKALPFDMTQFTYIILDEAHYMFSDAGFNNKCRLAVNELINSYCSTSVKIFISATMEEIEKPIRNKVTVTFGESPKISQYKTGTDYCYVNVKYFQGYESIVNSIKNDKTNNKWLIFVSNKDDGNYIKKELGEDVCEIIYSGIYNEQSESIAANSKFTKKVLVTTKVLDNGVNFEDELLTNIVIMAWDRVSYLQMLGRKRINIDDAQEVNLYIPKRYKKSFTLKKQLLESLEAEINLFKNDEIAFDRKYDNDLKLLGELQHLFYRDYTTGKYCINPIGEYRLYQDKNFFEYMQKRFELEGEYAFIYQQLEWLSLENTFSEENFVSEVLLNEDVKSLESYLESIVGKVMLQSKDRTELIEEIHLIDAHNSNIKENQIKLLKNINTLNSYLSEIKSNFIIKEFKTSRMANGKKKVFKSAWKVMRLSDK